MTLETDLVLDRRRLKHRLCFWQGLAILALVVAALIAMRPKLPGFSRQHLARLSITGLIGDDPQLTEALNRVAKDASVPALIVSIDSPGGSVGGGEALHDAIAKVAACKPVVAVMRGTAASAGYMVALPAQRIFAREGSITGSIGVLMETPEASGLLGKLGLQVETLVSGPLKDQPSLTHPTSPEGRQVLQGLVADMYDMFVGMVASGRHMDPAEVRKLADGRAYTGRQAKALGLIDDYGGEVEARDWLAREKQVSVSLPVQDIKPDKPWRRVFSASLHGLLQAIFGNSLAANRFDGPQALWDPGLK